MLSFRGTHENKGKVIKTNCVMKNNFLFNYLEIRRNKGDNNSAEYLIIDFLRLLQDFNFYIRGQKIYKFQNSFHFNTSSPDVAVSHFCDKTYSLTTRLIIETKFFENNNKGEPQVIAQALSIAQQADWDFSKPIYMVIFYKFTPCFYKVRFSKEVIENVRVGKENKDEVIVYKFYDNENLILQDEAGRKKLFRIFYHLLKEISQN